MESPISISLAREDDDCAVVAVSGEVDLGNAGELRSCLHEVERRGHRCVVIDMSGVTFCDSSCLSALVAAHRAVRSLDGSLRLASLQPSVLKVFRIAGLTKIFDIYDTVQEATAKS
ncbi:MAG: STAS domain-containing protein [Carbonactinosporaceae bacterium]